MSGAQILLECLVRENVDCIFGYPGGVTLPLYDAMYDHPIRHVLVRHEQNACFAAEGYARATGKVGVCCATSGPGATNLVTGLVDAMMDSIPVVALTGQVSTKLIGSDAFQEADTFGITRSCTKHNFLVKTIADLPQASTKRFTLPPAGGPGPVLVDIPKDVFQAQRTTRPSRPSICRLQGFHRRPRRTDPPRRADDVGSRSGPLVYAGGGIIAADARTNLRELVEMLDAPAVNTLMGLGALPAEHPNFISMPGMHGSYAANMGMTQHRPADCSRRALRRPRHRAPGGIRAARQSDSRGHRSGRNRQESALPTCPSWATSSACFEAEQGSERAGAAAQHEDRARARGLVAADPGLEGRASARRPKPPPTEIKPQHLMREIDRLSGGEAIVCSDVGQHQMWAAQLSASIIRGYGLTPAASVRWASACPSAIGAQFACPDKLVFAICGDGGFQMSIPELATIANHGCR